MRREKSAFASEMLKPLRPWAEAFADMPEAQLRLIGRLLAAVMPLVDAAEDARRDGLSELDSFDDLSPIGPIERLIVSELLWLRIMPSEFVRRIAEREALRRRAVYRDPTDDRAILLLIDSGPAMLGRRRLAALAGLLALGVAARRRGARLIWSATGFARDPIWLDGLDRRGLSRFVHQTGAEDLDAALLAERLDSAPEPAARNASALWTIAPAGWTAPDPPPTHRLEIGERWPERAGEPMRAEITAIAATGARRAAHVDLPEESVCAALLRAPFRLRGRASSPLPEGAHWAPLWMAPEADLGSFYLRLGDEIVVRRSQSRALRLRLPADAHLLGVRAAGALRTVVVWREGAAVWLASVSEPGREPVTATAALPPEHPLLTRSHPPDAVPPAFRFGRKGGVTIASPDGQLFEVAELDVWAEEAIAVAPQAHNQDLRVRARAQNWVLCEGADGLLLLKPRSGRRVKLAENAEAPEGLVRQCFAIGETGGAVIATDEGVRWAPPRGWNGAEIVPQPPVPEGAMLLRVDPMEHGSSVTRRALEDRRWQLWFWSGQTMLAVLAYDGGEWRLREQPAPALPGRPLAMTLSGKKCFALIEGDAGTPTLIEFRLGGMPDLRESAQQPWLAEAPCVAL